MSDLYVDPMGMTYLYNQVDRIFHDAYAASRHVYRYADLEWSEVGIIFALFRTHERARGLIGGTVDATAIDMEGLRTAIYRCQQLLVHADTQARQAFDDYFPSGGPEPAALSAVVDEIRPDLPKVLAPGAFTDAAWEPSRYLQPPQVDTSSRPFQMDYLYDLLSPSSWVRQLYQWLLGFDPFEPWLQMLTGDWDGYARCGIVWQQVGQCAEDLCTNLVCAVQDVPFVWRGNAATLLQVSLLDHAVVLDHLGDACRFYADRYRDAADSAYNCFDAVSSLIGDMLDRLFYASIAASIGTATFPSGIGPATGYSVAAFYIAHALDIYFQISAKIDALKTAIAGISAAMDAFEANQTWRLKEPAAFALPPTT